MLDVSEFNKDQLQEYLVKNDDGVGFVDLDMRKSVENLRNEVKALQEKVSVAPQQEEVKQSAVATHIKNLSTGLVFEANETLVKYLGENGMPCDKDGNRV